MTLALFEEGRAGSLNHEAVTWSSDNGFVVIVNATGGLSAVAQGDAVIRVHDEDHFASVESQFILHVQ